MTDLGQHGSLGVRELQPFPISEAVAYSQTPAKTSPFGWK
jgi:hypothetical protein